MSADSNDDHEPLGTPPEQIPDDVDYELVDFYASHNFAEIEMLVDILQDHGIHCYTRKMEPPGLPVSVGREGELRIVVQDNRLEEAGRLIEEAVAEGPVPDDGKFLPQG